MYQRLFEFFVGSFYYGLWGLKTQPIKVGQKGRLEGWREREEREIRRKGGKRKDRQMKR